MKISPLAGKPAPPAMLVDVPRLVSAYYTEVPDPAIPGQRVAFGTSGHRGSSFLKTLQRMARPRHHAGHLPLPRAAGHRRPAVPRHRHARAVRAGVRQCARSAGGQRRRRHAGRARRIHADPGGVARHPHLQSRADAPASPTASSSRLRTIRRRTAGSSTTRRTADRRRPRSPAGSKRRPTSC